jgi:hypothetical protein
MDGFFSPSYLLFFFASWFLLALAQCIFFYVDIGVRGLDAGSTECCSSANETEHTNPTLSNAIDNVV